MVNLVTCPKRVHVATSNFKCCLLVILLFTIGVSNKDIPGNRILVIASYISYTLDKGRNRSFVPALELIEASKVDVGLVKIVS